MRSRRWRLPALDLLPAFEAAARHLSFTRAGEELALTQSAVSRQIQALEEALGVPLFERRTRALALTRHGELFRRATEDALQRLNDSVAALRGVAADRTVTVSTTPGFASLWLIPRLAGYTRAHPRVDVRISASNEYVNLEREGIDVAIRYAPAGSVSGAQRLFGEEVVPVCSPALCRAHDCTLKEPADLARHVLLHLDDPRAAWLDWRLWLHAFGLEDLQPAGTLHFSHYDQLIHAAIDGQGVALGRLPLLRQILRDGRLVAPFRKTVASTRAYHLIVSARGAAKAEVADFAAWLLAQTEKEALPAAPAPVHPGGEAPRTGSGAARRPPGSPRR